MEKICYEIEAKEYALIPGSPIAYWVSPNMIGIFSRSRTLDNFADCCTGMQTGNNDKYVRNWFEISISDFDTSATVATSKWVKYNCGGESRKWYGNHNKVVFWQNDGQAIKSEKGAVIRNSSFFFKEGISWKRIGSTDFFLRYLPQGFIFDQAGDSMFIREPDNLFYVLAFVNTKVALEAFKFIAPTLNLTAGSLNKLPILDDREQGVSSEIDVLVTKNIQAERQDWDAFETSWDFKKHPLI